MAISYWNELSVNSFIKISIFGNSDTIVSTETKKIS